MLGCKFWRKVVNGLGKVGAESWTESGQKLAWVTFLEGVLGEACSLGRVQSQGKIGASSIAFAHFFWYTTYHRFV